MNQEESFFTTWAPRILSILRIVVGGLYLQHGTAKFLQFPHVAQLQGTLLGGSGSGETHRLHGVILSRPIIVTRETAGRT